MAKKGMTLDGANSRGESAIKLAQSIAASNKGVKPANSSSNGGKKK